MKEILFLIIIIVTWETTIKYEYLYYDKYLGWKYKLPGVIGHIVTQYLNALE